ncbi:MAG: hypothetical protein AVDCRST_MAG05-1206, partial [uncultured Rubrobacteraceae bacterium]
GRGKLCSVPDGLARRYRGAGPGQHAGAHARGGAGTWRGAGIGRRREPRAGGPLGLRGGRPLGPAGAVGPGVLGGQVRRGGVFDLLGRQGVARPGRLRPDAGGGPDGSRRGLYAGRGLQRTEPQDRCLLPGLPAAVRRPRDGRHGHPTARFWSDLRAAYLGDLQRAGGLFGNRRLVAEVPPEARGRSGLAHRSRPDLPRAPPGLPGPPV